MRLILTIIMCLCLGTIGSIISAEEKENGQMDPQAMMELWKKLGTPGEPHKVFSSLVGSWATHTKEWMEPGKPPSESTGTAEMKMLLDGRFLYQEFHGQMMGQPFSGIGIDGYDNVTQKYVTAWMDSMGTGIFLMEGTATPDGKIITLHGSHPKPGGGEMTHRAVWTLVDSNSQIFEMFGGHQGEQERKMFKILYTRKK